MKNQYDELKDLLGKSKKLFNKNNLNETREDLIKYGIIKEEEDSKLFNNAFEAFKFKSSAPSIKIIFFLLSNEDLFKKLCIFLT